MGLKNKFSTIRLGIGHQYATCLSVIEEKRRKPEQNLNLLDEQLLIQINSTLRVLIKPSHSGP